jgi:hypothetical protein
MNMPRPRIGAEPMSPAERQAQHRARLRQHNPTLSTPARPAEGGADRSRRNVLSRPGRWAAALATLVAVQEEYRAWRDNLPTNLEGSRLADKLGAIAKLDLEELQVIDPRAVTAATDPEGAIANAPDFVTRNLDLARTCTARW